MAKSTKSNSDLNDASYAERFSPEERQRMIAEAAYFRALARGFGGGDPVEDWISAERQIDDLLAGQTSQST